MSALNLYEALGPPVLVKSQHIVFSGMFIPARLIQNNKITICCDF